MYRVPQNTYQYFLANAEAQIHEKKGLSLPSFIKAKVSRNFTCDFGKPRIWNI